MDHPKPRFDPRSPVQDEPARGRYFIGAFVLLMAAVWAWENVRLPKFTPPTIHRHSPEPEDSTATAAVREPPPITSIVDDGPVTHPANPARGDVRYVFSNDDYPAEAQRAGDEGTVQARLGIDPSGRVARCTIIRSSGHAALDRTTCAILKQRATFTPAHDAAGNAVSDTYVTPPVTWRLQD